VIPGAGHLMPLQDPDGVGRAIAAFVERHLSSNRAASGTRRCPADPDPSGR
jgi:hypothetical protein